MHIDGREFPHLVAEQIAEEGRAVAEDRVAAGLEWPQVEGEDTLPDAVAWSEAWEAVVAATRATEMANGVDPRVVPSWPRGEYAMWALGRHTDGGPGLWLINLGFSSDDTVDWSAMDLDEEGLVAAPPIALLEKVPYRESEAANRAAWAARYPSYEPFAPPDEDDPS